MYTCIPDGVWAGKDCITSMSCASAEPASYDNGDRGPGMRSLWARSKSLVGAPEPQSTPPQHQLEHQHSAPLTPVQFSFSAGKKSSESATRASNGSPDAPHALPNTDPKFPTVPLADSIVSLSLAEPASSSGGDKPFGTKPRNFTSLWAARRSKTWVGARSKTPSVDMPGPQSTPPLSRPARQRSAPVIPVTRENSRFEMSTPGSASGASKSERGTVSRALHADMQGLAQELASATATLTIEVARVETEDQDA